MTKAPHNALQKIELCPTKANSQQTQLSGLKFFFFFLKKKLYSEAFGKHRPFLLCFFFLWTFQLTIITYAVFFYIQNCKMCLSKKIFYQYFVYFTNIFYPTWDSFFSESILYVSTLHWKPEEIIKHPWLFKLGKWNNRRSVYYFLKVYVKLQFQLRSIYQKCIREGNYVFFKSYRGSIRCWWICACLSLISIKVQYSSKLRKLLMSWFFSKKEVLSDIRSEIHLVRGNIVSTGQFFWVLKNLYPGLIICDK